MSTVKSVLKNKVIIVIRIELRILETNSISDGWDEMTDEYLNCSANLNLEVDIGVNGGIGTIVTKWDILFYSDSSLFSFKIYVIICL